MQHAPHRSRRPTLRHLATTSVTFALLFMVGRAGADVTVVLDPSPPITGTLVVGDLAETTIGVNERYRFSGGSRNDGNASRRLLIRARADGLAIPGSQQSFLLAPGSASYTYDFTYAGHPSPATVGLEFEAPDGVIAFIAGVFQAAPAAPVPITTPVTLGLLAAVLLLLAARRLGKGSLPG